MYATYLWEMVEDLGLSIRILCGAGVSCGVANTRAEWGGDFDNPSPVFGGYNVYC